MDHALQQAYLEAAYEIARAELLPECSPLDRVILSLSWAKATRGRPCRNAIGQIWYNPTPDKVAMIAVAPPAWHDPVTTVGVLLHEVCHEIAGAAAGHKGRFAELARRIGLGGPMKATEVGPELRARIESWAEALPPFPACGFDAPDKAKKGSTLRLFKCECGVKVRIGRDVFEAHCDLCGTAFERQS